MSATRDKLRDDLATLMAGHRVEDVLDALEMHLACSIGFAATNKKNAENLIVEIGGRMMEIIRKQWSELRRYRAESDRVSS